MSNLNYRQQLDNNKQMKSINFCMHNTNCNAAQQLPKTTDSLNEDNHKKVQVDSNIFSYQQEQASEHILRQLLYYQNSGEWQMISNINTSTVNAVQNIFEQVKQRLPQLLNNIVNKRQFCKESITNIQQSVNQTINLLSKTRNKIKLISEYRFKRQKKLKVLHIKLKNLIDLKKQAQKVTTIKKQLQGVYQYGHILKTLKKTQKYSTEAQQIEGSLASSLKIYIPMHESRLVRILSENIKVDTIIQSKYIWRKQDDQILAKAVNLALRNNKIHNSDNEQFNINISMVCRSFIKILAHIRMERQTQNYLTALLYSVLQSTLILMSQQTSTSKWNHVMILESMSIMQYSPQSNSFFSKFISTFQQQKQREYKLFMDQLCQISWEGIAQEDLRSWIQNFNHKYAWLHQNGINKQFDEIRKTVTKKIFRPLLLDSLFYIKNKKNRSFLKYTIQNQFLNSAKIVDLYQTHQQDLFKNCYKRYHCYRIWHRHQQIYHILHPYSSKQCKWAMLSVEYDGKHKQFYETKSNKKREFFLNQIIHENIIGYLVYGNILRYLWGNDSKYQQIISLWTDIAAEYIIRKQPQLISDLMNKDYLFHQQILNKCNDIEKAANYQKKLEQYLSLKVLQQQQQEQLYNYIIRNKFKILYKQFLQRCIEKIGCGNEVQKMREVAYKKFVCSKCQK